MKLSPRDQKIFMVIVPLALVAAFWFLILSPKREEARTAGEELKQAEDKRDAAEAKVRQARAAQASFASDYAEVVRLGKAVPQTVDTPSLLVQLDKASRGTSIQFNSITAGERTSSSGSSSSTASPQGEGGPKGQEAPAGDEASGGAPPAAPAEGAATPASGAGAPSASTPALESVPLTFEFVGDYFDLASFFHRTKRFVSVDGRKVVQVQGRLLTFDSVKISGEEAGGGALTAEIGATVWLTPAQEGATGGATPDGPGGAQGASAPSSAGGSTSSPTAAVTP